MLGRLPSEDMHEVRAILLGRLGRHEGALQIYVYQLDDHATAEEYVRSSHLAKLLADLLSLQILQTRLRVRPSDAVDHLSPPPPHLPPSSPQPPSPLHPRALPHLSARIVDRRDRGVRPPSTARGAERYQGLPAEDAAEEW